MNLDAEQVVRQLRRGEDSDLVEIVFRCDRPVGSRRNDLTDEFTIFANPRLEEVDFLLVEVSTDAIDPPVRKLVRRRERSEGRWDPTEAADQGEQQR